MWGVDKRPNLLGSLQTDQPPYRDITPVQDLAFSFRPQRVSPDYASWPRIDEWCALPPLLGLNENRKGSLIGVARQELTNRLAPYFDPQIPREELSDDLRGIRDEAARFRPDEVRASLMDKGIRVESFAPFVMKPFDRRWAYVETKHKMWNEARPELVTLRHAGVRFLLARNRAFGEGDAGAFLLSSALGDQHALHKDAYFIPTRLPWLYVEDSATARHGRGRRAPGTSKPDST